MGGSIKQEAPERIKAFRGLLSLSKNYPIGPVSGRIEETGDVFMEDWRKDARREPILVDLEVYVIQ